ncbi:unnamed protein product [Penicillium salamii]|uniref:Major facilitator superfamily domain, general substrate transporter n=1 Tax=Penicillium salamii TaxID=1612424 RepID=A0A9W4JDZ9_9EURO|nr:unnamed protein product [Penicillium salamii]CAG8384121.1 unnamed protein product [Penicillium salamii]CAG8386513.1 unnamed protein product [Penicillium salamii]CAG8400951.1 unnamed protein product [Penicillium salamii]
MSEMRADEQNAQDENPGSSIAHSTVYRLWTHCWFQILLISFICFCCPGVRSEGACVGRRIRLADVGQMYNALTGMGGSGQVDQAVTANANVALLSATAATALFVVGPIFDRVGPRVCLLLGGWTYPLYSGSLLCFNATNNGAFVIASGAILGVGASFLWVAQGAIMTTYVSESHKGRAIAVFWFIFNLGGGVGSLASFGINYDSKTGTVSNGTYTAFLVIMAVGWSLGILVCPPSYVRSAHLQKKTDSERNWRQVARQSLKTIVDWRVLCMLPLFFSANVFYSYQQNVVNGMNFNIRTRSLNGALYWIAQMLGSLLMGMLLDIPQLTRPMRARIAWAFLVVTGMGIWGGGYAFQKWSDSRLQQGLKQDIDYTDGHTSVGPMFLYIFYGAYDAFWQSFCYWLIGAQSNSPAVAAVLVGAYKTFQSVGGAMAWRLNAMGKPAMTQFAMDWGLCMGSLCIAIPTVLAITMTSETDSTEKEPTVAVNLDEEAKRD